MKRLFLFTIVAVWLGPAAAAAQQTVPLYDDLGDLHVPISTSVPLAQEYFDQGMRMYYGFNHAEAIRAFEEAARLDPECAICYWGVALAYGPNINLPMDEAGAREAYAALERAREREELASEKERALIDALAERYEPTYTEDRTELDRNYARAMGRLVEEFPDDPEIKVLHAEALMDLSPWDYWTQEGEPGPETETILTTLEDVIAEHPDHPGACHFYIHAVEAAHPELAVPCAERLADLMPGAGHLVHMPAHIYIRVGRYEDAIQANEHAVHADESYIRDRGPGGVYPMLYYPHNYDFLAFAAMMAGREDLAIESARQVEALLPEELLYSPEMGGFAQHFATGPLRLLVRFGRWDEILETQPPPEDLPYARAMWDFAQGMALSATGEPGEAEEHLERIRVASEDPGVTEAALLFNPAAPVLRIAEEVLAAEIASAEGNHEEAVRRLREAARIEDGLTYGEPPDWPVPVRHHLGAALLAAERPEEAEQVYEEDLARFPENGWALYGLAESLRRQDRTAEAREAEERFSAAWSGADVSLRASRF